jgi:hypothetical protein
MFVQQIDAAFFCGRENKKTPIMVEKAKKHQNAR